MEGAQAQLKLLRRVRRRRGLLVLLALLVLAAVLIVVLRPSGEEIKRVSDVLSKGRVDITARRLTSYEITYRVDIRSGDDVARSIDRVVVDRPFNSVAATQPVPEDSGGEEAEVVEVPFSATAQAFGRSRVGDDALAVPPDIPVGDRRPDASLEEMREHGYAELRERRQVADRLCRVYRIGGGSDEMGLEPLSRVESDYTDVCIDEAGLVLEEVTYQAGEITSQRFAEGVDENEEIGGDEPFDLGNPTIEVRQGGGSLQEVDPKSRLPGGNFWDLSQTPKGFTHRGRFAVVPPQPGLTDRTQAETVVTSMTDVYTKGIDLLLIDRSATRGGNSPYDDDPNARKVDAGEIGRGELRYSLRMSEVRVRTATGRYVRVAGTLSGERLLAIARALRPLPEGSLVPFGTD